MGQATSAPRRVVALVAVFFAGGPRTWKLVSGDCREFLFEAFFARLRTSLPMRFSKPRTPLSDCTVQPRSRWS